MAAISIQVGEMDSILIIKLPHAHIPETPVPTSLRLFFSPLPLTRGSIFVQSNRSRSLLSPEPFLRLVRRQRLCSTISQTSNPSSTVTGQTWEPGFELMTPALFVKNWSVFMFSMCTVLPVLKQKSTSVAVSTVCNSYRLLLSDLVQQQCLNLSAKQVNTFQPLSVAGISFTCIFMTLKSVRTQQ